MNYVLVGTIAIILFVMVIRWIVAWCQYINIRSPYHDVTSTKRIEIRSNVPVE